ncbi:MAG: hypothetical protein QN699_09830, partial [Nitrososphaeraceae archaeon]|nr:hypothetical protein [Nitrososphaeraceae archaeon]
ILNALQSLLRQSVFSVLLLSIRRLKNIMLHEHLTIDKWQKDQVLRSSNCVPLHISSYSSGLSSSAYTIFNQSKRL